jgi:competence protein ComEC
MVGCRSLLLSVLLLALVCLTPAAHAEIAVPVHFLDAGNGDAALISFPDGSTALIDCGPPELSKQTLLQLQTFGVSTIDLLAPSRSTPDVLGGCNDIVRYMTVRNVLWSPTSSPSTAARTFDAELTRWEVNRLPVTSGWTQDYGGARLSLLNPAVSPTNDLPDESQVLLLEYGASGVLFAGAIHERGEHVVQSYLMGKSITVLRAADHGVKGTSTPDFLSSVFPNGDAGAVILSYSAARGAPQPDDEVKSRLAALVPQGSLLKTAQDGPVTISLGFEGSTGLSRDRY